MPFIQKPFELAQIARALRRLLDDPEAQTPKAA
jgi:hypothetical protein